MKNYALKNPILFSLILIILFFIMMVGSYVAGALMSGIPDGKNLGELFGKLLTAAVLLLILWKFDWFQVAGITNPGNLKNWLVILPLLVYAVLSTTYAYTGIIKFSILTSADDLFIGANMIGTGLTEELAFRGLIFYCLLLAWSHKKNSLFISGIISALLFGISHLVWVIMGKELMQGLMQASGAFCSGIFYAAIVYQTRSIWPAVLTHGLTNAFVYLTITGIPNYQETVHNGILDILLGIPLVVYGLFILYRLRDRTRFDPI